MTNVRRGLAEEVCFLLCRKVTFAVITVIVVITHQSLPLTIKDLTKLSTAVCFRVIFWGRKGIMYSYTRPQPTPQPLSFSLSRDISAPRQHSLNSNAIGQFSSQAVLGKKTNIAIVTERSVFLTSFYLGVAEDIYQDQHTEILPKINVYLPPEQNIFLIPG